MREIRPNSQSHAKRRQDFLSGNGSPAETTAKDDARAATDDVVGGLKALTSGGREFAAEARQARARTERLDELNARFRALEFGTPK